MPDEARTHDAAGVEAFTRYYLSLINRSPDVAEAVALRDLSEACETCERIAGDTAKDAAAGYDYQGGEISIVSAAPATVKGDTSEFAFLADQVALVVHDRTGKPVPGLSFKPLHKVSSGSTARWDAERGTWVMTQLTFG